MIKSEIPPRNHVTTKLPDDPEATEGLSSRTAVPEVTWNSTPRGTPELAKRWPHTPARKPSHTTTKFPRLSAATDGPDWLFDVKVLTRNSGPSGAPVLA